MTLACEYYLFLVVFILYEIPYTYGYVDSESEVHLTPSLHSFTIFCKIAKLLNFGKLFPKGVRSSLNWDNFEM